MKNQTFTLFRGIVDGPSYAIGKRKEDRFQVTTDGYRNVLTRLPVTCPQSSYQPELERPGSFSNYDW